MSNSAAFSGASSCAPFVAGDLVATLEGTVVSFVAFVIKAKYSNLSKGESNNCKTGGKQFNDGPVLRGPSHFAVQSSPVLLLFSRRYISSDDHGTRQKVQVNAPYSR
jgi:hypothetical protein